MTKPSRARPMAILCGILALFAALLPILWLNPLGINQEPRLDIQPDNSYAQTLTVAADWDYQPYSFYDENGNPSGHDVELIYALANRMGMNIKLAFMPWNKAYAALERGEVDLLLGLEHIPQNAAHFELSIPLQNDPFAIFSKGPLQDIYSLNGRRIALLKGSYSYQTSLEPYELNGDTVYYDSYREAFAAVRNGECDYVVSRYFVGRREEALFGGQNAIRMRKLLAANDTLCIGAAKGNLALIEKVNQAIIATIQNGTHARLNEKWLENYVRIITWRDFISANQTLLVLAVCCAALILSFIFYLRQRSIVRLRQKEQQRILEYQSLLTEATKGLYESIYELDITHNCAAGDGTHKYFESLGIPGDTPYDQALLHIAQKQIKEEYRAGYLQTFSPEHVLTAFKSGTTSLSYDFMIAPHGSDYYWIRITARLFSWEADRSVRMIIYRQNIDAEKNREKTLLEQATYDTLTGLYNRAAAEKLVRERLKQSACNGEYALFMLDIDNFKTVNDTYGHAAGDFAIAEFAHILKQQFRSSDIVGRMGGDEFVVFLQTPSAAWVEKKARSLAEALHRELEFGSEKHLISASIGIALLTEAKVDFETLYKKADAALYQTKNRGKNGFTIYREEPHPAD